MSAIIVALKIMRSVSTEVKIVFVTLAVLLLLPTFAVVVFAASGASLIGDAVAYLNPVTRLVELFDPNGNKIGEVEVTTNWPVRGYVTDEFGTSEDWRRKLGLGVHSGIDIANSIGEPVTPFLKGKIIYNDDSDDNACGKSVKIQHDYNITSTYCHLDSTAQIPPTTDVEPGMIIGYLGNTGTSTGPHLHLTIRVYGILVNPRTFLSGNPESPDYNAPAF